MEFRVSEHDSAEFFGARLQLQRWLDNNPREVCTVYQMRPGQDSFRTIGANGKITPHQGRSTGYDGDGTIRMDRSEVTIQVHKFELRQEDKEVVASDVPIICIWVPKKMHTNWAAQPSQP